MFLCIRCLSIPRVHSESSSLDSAISRSHPPFPFGTTHSTPSNMFSASFVNRELCLGFAAGVVVAFLVLHLQVDLSVFSGFLNRVDMKVRP